MADPNKPFMPPVPRDHDDASFSEMVPFRSSKINLLKSPLFILAVMAALVTPFMFTLFAAASNGQTAQARAEALTTANIVTVFVFVMLVQFIAYLYMRTQRPIWTYLVAFAAVSGLLYFPILSQPFFYIFRQIPLGTMNPEYSENFVTQFMRMLWAAGLMEELLKAVPILFAAFLTVRAMQDPRMAQNPVVRLLHIRGPLDGALMGIFAGGGFIFIETAVQYVPGQMARIFQQTNDIGMAMASALLLLLPRVFGGIVGHMAYSGIFGYFIGLSVIRPRQRWKLLAIGYLSASLIHALWNSVPVISEYLMYVVAIAAAVGLGGAILKARQLELVRGGGGTRLDTMGSIVVDRPASQPQQPAAPAYAPPAPASYPAPPAGVAEALGLDVEGLMIPLRAGGRVDLAAEPALAGRGAGVSGSIFPHPTRANVLGLRNDGSAPWTARLRDGSRQMIERDQTIRLAPGVDIAFCDGLTGAVVKLG